jgi:hypothetical protein
MVAFRPRVVSLALAIGAIALLLYAWRSFYSVTELQKPFDRSTWLRAQHLDNSADPGCYRGGMALDLVRAERLIAKDSQFVEHLLGEPAARSAQEWRYPIGQCTGFGWNHTELRVHLDPHLMVKRVEIKHVPGL